MKVGAKVSNDEVIMELGIDELTNADVYFKKITVCLEVCYLKNRVDKPLGFYWHSFATDFELAFKEAKKIYKYIFGKEKYPLYIDIEIPNYYGQKKKRILKEVIKGFCTFFEEKGLIANVASNTLWFKIFVTYNKKVTKSSLLKEWKNLKALYCNYNELEGDYIFDKRNNGLNRNELFI